MLRDHKPYSTTQFRGLYRRGNPEDTPEGFFNDANNLKFIGKSGIQTRDGIGISQAVNAPLQNIKRIYNYPTLTHNTLIVLTVDDITGEGNIYHIVDSTTVFGPVLTIEGMEDFAFLPYAGRGYISPFASLFPTLSKPSGGPALTGVDDVGMGIGLYQYAYTFITAAGETTPSPITSITTNADIPTPTDTPTIASGFGLFSNQLVIGATYKWLITFAVDLADLNPPTASTQETDAGPESAGFVAPVTPPFFDAIYFTINIPTGIPTNIRYINVYRTQANGATFFLETIIPVFATPSYNTQIQVGLRSDAQIGAQNSPPIVNTTGIEAVDVSGIEVGPGSVTARKLYRTAVDGSQLKLLTTLADNITTIFSDTTADGSLGADVPTTNTAVVDGPRVEKGLENEFLYVYAGDGTAARPAAGNPLSGTLTIGNGAAGFTDAGVHIFGFVYETISGFLSAPFSLQAFTTSASQSVSFGAVPASSDPIIVARHLVASKVIPSFDGNVNGHDLFFVPDATIPNGTDLFLNNISFYDNSLLDDANYLIDNFAEIPAGAVLGLYHNRLALATTFEQISIAYLSTPGEPEAIDQVDGILVFPPDGNPITNIQELRDVIYLMKKSKTGAYVDNDDDPVTWGPFALIDAALGCPVHGVAVVIDSGSNNVDFLLITTFQGVTLFNGRYINPELSWNIEDYWRAFDKSEFRKIQVLLDPIRKWILTVTPERGILYADYSNGLDPKNIRWMPWSFVMGVNTIAIVNTDEIIFGSDIVT